MAIFIVMATLGTWKPSAHRRLSYNADFHAETSGLRTMSSAKGHIVFGEHVTKLAVLQSHVALQTVHRQPQEELAAEADVFPLRACSS